MSLLTVRGIYRDGKIELSERPAGAPEAAEVLVTFLAPSGSSMEVQGAGDESEARREAGQRLLEMMEEGFDLGGPPYPKREELYDRANRLNDRLDERGS